MQVSVMLEAYGIVCAELSAMTISMGKSYGLVFNALLSERDLCGLSLAKVEGKRR